MTNVRQGKLVERASAGPASSPTGVEDRYRGLVELSPDAIAIHKRGRIVYANPAAVRLWGARTPLDLEDRSLLELIHPDSRQSVLKTLQRLREGYSIPPAEVRFLRLDGTYVDVEVAATPFLHEGAQAVQIVARDVTRRRQVERRLRDAEAKYRTLVEQIPAITYTVKVDAAMTTLFISPQVESILGFTPEEYCEDPDLWVKHLHPEDRGRALAEYVAGRESAVPFSFEYRMIGRGGRVVWFRNDAMVLRDENGRAALVHGVMLDITQQKQMEEDLERALRTERGVAERLRALDELKNTFLHAVSHELRTPLSAVLGYALTLEREEVVLSSQERIEITRRLAANARKLEQLLTDLLDLDRLERGIIEPRRRPTDVASLVRQAVETSELRETRAVEVEAQTALVAVDASKVERIIENLLANAAKHTPPGTRVWVRVAEAPGGVLISVDDEGSGVPEALRAAIFEPFIRGPDAPSHSPGVGIGLSLVASFAELHHGRAWVEERPGGGASFKVYLPGGAQ